MPILNYGCESWGFHAAPDVEKVHTDFIKQVLGVCRRSPNAMLYFEVGRGKLLIKRKILICKYWCNILETNNCILKAMYECMLNEINNRPRTCNNWAYKVKKELYELGLGEFWDSQSIPNKALFINVLKQRLNDVFIQGCYTIFDSSNKCLAYKNLVDTFTLQYYLTKSINDKYKSLICKYRISSHILAVEKGRHFDIPRHQRKVFAM